MAENSKILWTHHTINFWWGCAKVSDACTHCYAEGQDAHYYPEGGVNPSRLGPAKPSHWGPNAPRLLRVGPAIREAMRYQRQAEKEGIRYRAFTNSMADFFEDRRDLDEARLQALEAIRRTPNLDWLLLTKRPERVIALLNRVRDAIELEGGSGNQALRIWIDGWLEGKPPANVWLGTTCENQEWTDRRLADLLKVSAAVRFLSVEPMLGEVHLKGDLAGLHWVIAGGESGAQARPMQAGWARALRDQCAAAGIPFIFKQWGEFCAPSQLPEEAFVIWDANENAAGNPDLNRPMRFGKKVTGRFLDGVEHEAYPVPNLLLAAAGQTIF